MEAEKQDDWVFMVTARAPTNIAVIKYWGKRDQKLILPINSSISVTLNPHDLSAITTVAVSPSFKEDRLWLNGKEVSLQGDRYQNCLREIRSRATDVVDTKSGRTITKEDWQNLHVHIVSKNNFPTAAGLASSAAGFACLVYSIAQLMGVQERYKGEISSIARVGSGSACRSLYGGFVEWEMGEDDDGKDSVATQLVAETHWEDLFVIIAVQPVPCNLLGYISSYFYLNDTSKRIISMVEHWNKAAGTPHAAYTFDAGPNAVLFAPSKEKACELLSRLLFYFPPAADKNVSSYVVGDVETLKFKGVDYSFKPHEVDGLNITRFLGELDYILCTRPGGGPLVLKDHLIDSSTGLPV